MGMLLRRAMMGSGLVTYDPYFEQVVLLMYFDALTTDVKSHAFTNSGATLDTTNKKFGSGSSNFVGASSQYMNTPDTADWTLGFSDFTAEVWFRGSTNPAAIGTIIFQCDSAGTVGTRGGPYMAINPTGKFIGGAGWALQGVGTTTVTDGNWHHLAVCRSINSLYLFVDGVLEATVVAGSTSVPDAATPLTIGRFGDFADYYLTGNLDDLRVTKGVARYTANFTPPAAAFPNSSAPALSYATWNPSDKTGTQAVLSNGNLTFTATTSFELARATLGKTSGKWFWEVTLTTAADATVGVANTSQSITGDQWVGISANSWGWAQFNGFLYTNNAPGVSAGSLANGDVIGLALDMDSKTISYYKNGVFAGFQIGLTGTVLPAIGNFTGTTINATANFGATQFKYSVPPGYNPGIDSEPSISPAAQTYATWNPADKDADIALSIGNLAVSQSGIGAVRATIGKTSGKWYWEVTSQSTGNEAGVLNGTASLASDIGGSTNGLGWYQDGTVVRNNVTLFTASTYTTGDVLGFALDVGAGTISLYKNGVFSVTGSIVITGTIFPAYGYTTGGVATANFGQYPFKYAVPAGFNSGVY